MAPGKKQEAVPKEGERWDPEQPVVRASLPPFEEPEVGPFFDLSASRTVTCEALFDEWTDEALGAEDWGDAAQPFIDGQTFHLPPHLEAQTAEWKRAADIVKAAVAPPAPAAAEDDAAEPEADAAATKDAKGKKGKKDEKKKEDKEDKKKKGDVQAAGAEREWVEADLDAETGAVLPKIVVVVVVPKEENNKPLDDAPPEPEPEATTDGAPPAGTEEEPAAPPAPPPPEWPPARERQVAVGFFRDALLKADAVVVDADAAAPGLTPSLEGTTDKGEPPPSSGEPPAAAADTKAPVHEDDPLSSSLLLSSSSSKQEGACAAESSAGVVDPTTRFEERDEVGAAALRLVSTCGAYGDAPFLWEAIYPQNKAGRPCYNPGGKYVVKLWLAGKWRRVVVDDRIPVDATGAPTVVSSRDRCELWPAILAKALYKIRSVVLTGGGEDEGDGDVDVSSAAPKHDEDPVGWTADFVQLATSALAGYTASVVAPPAPLTSWSEEAVAAFCEESGAARNSEGMGSWWASEAPVCTCDDISLHSTGGLPGKKKVPGAPRPRGRRGRSRGPTAELAQEAAGRRAAAIATMRATIDTARDEVLVAVVRGDDHSAPKICPVLAFVDVTAEASPPITKAACGLKPKLDDASAAGRHVLLAWDCPLADPEDYRGPLEPVRKPIHRIAKIADLLRAAPTETTVLRLRTRRAEPERQSLSHAWVRAAAPADDLAPLLVSAKDAKSSSSSSSPPPPHETTPHAADNQLLVPRKAAAPTLLCVNARDADATLTLSVDVDRLVQQQQAPPVAKATEEAPPPQGEEEDPTDGEKALTAAAAAAAVDAAVAKAAATTDVDEYFQRPCVLELREVLAPAPPDAAAAAMIPDAAPESMLPAVGGDEEEKDGRSPAPAPAATVVAEGTAEVEAAVFARLQVAAAATRTFSALTTVVPRAAPGSGPRLFRVDLDAPAGCVASFSSSAPVRVGGYEEVYAALGGSVATQRGKHASVPAGEARVILRRLVTLPAAPDATAASGDGAASPGKNKKNKKIKKKAVSRGSSNDPPHAPPSPEDEKPPVVGGSSSSAADLSLAGSASMASIGSVASACDERAECKVELWLDRAELRPHCTVHVANLDTGEGVDCPLLETAPLRLLRGARGFLVTATLTAGAERALPAGEWTLYAVSPSRPAVPVPPPALLTIDKAAGADGGASEKKKKDKGDNNKKKKSSSNTDDDDNHGAVRGRCEDMPLVTRFGAAYVPNRHLRLFRDVVTLPTAAFPLHLNLRVNYRPPAKDDGATGDLPPKAPLPVRLELWDCAASPEPPARGAEPVDAQAMERRAHATRGAKGSRCLVEATGISTIVLPCFWPEEHKAASKVLLNAAAAAAADGAPTTVSFVVECEVDSDRFDAPEPLRSTKPFSAGPPSLKAPDGDAVSTGAPVVDGGPATSFSSLDWELDIVSATEGVVLTADSSDEAARQRLRKSWEAVEPGRAQRAAKLRTQYLERMRPPPEDGAEMVVSADVNGGGVPVGSPKKGAAAAALPTEPVDPEVAALEARVAALGAVVSAEDEARRERRRRDLPETRVDETPGNLRVVTADQIKASLDALDAALDACPFTLDKVRDRAAAAAQAARDDEAKHADLIKKWRAETRFDAALLIVERERYRAEMAHRATLDQQAEADAQAAAAASSEAQAAA